MCEIRRILLCELDRGPGGALAQALADEGYEFVSPEPRTLAELQACLRSPGPDALVWALRDLEPAVLAELTRIRSELPLPILLFVERSDRAQIREALRAGVSAYVVEWSAARRLRPIIDVAAARFREHESLRGDLAAARGNLEERKLVERAKGILMQKRALPEAEAYRLLRKLAMDRRLRLIDMAQHVIATSDLL